MLYRKKYVGLLLALACGFSLAGCTQETTPPPVSPENIQQPSQPKAEAPTISKPDEPVDTQAQPPVIVPPKAETPKTEAPKKEPPKVETPKVDPPVVTSPDTEPPVVPPVVAPPVVEPPPVVAPPEVEPPEEGSDLSITIQVGNKSFAARLADNATARAFGETLPLTLAMKDLNANEKFYYLEKGLTSNGYSPERIENGDLMLYGSDCLVLFYESFSTPYSYTRLGAVEDTTGFKAALGSGSVTVTFSRG